MPVYAVLNKETGKYRMVDTNHRSNALSQVASDTFEVTIPSAAEAVRLAGQGVQIEAYVPVKARGSDAQTSINLDTESA